MLDHAFEDHDEMRDREAADRDTEKSRDFLHATGAIRYCPACQTDVLVSRRGYCLWCDTPTSVPPVAPGRASHAATTSGTADLQGRAA